MTTRCYWPLVLFVLVSLVGCSALPVSLEEATQPGANTPLPLDGSTAYPLPTPAPTQASRAGTPQAATSTSGQLLRIWLPPDFDPEQNSPASQILKARLEQFETMHPGMQLEVRVKALDGPGGMLDALVATSAAAPDVLPDLVLLPRPLMESAALKGLLYPYDGLTTIMRNDAWFEYAQEMSRLKDSTYGIPFAGDALVLVHSSAGQVSAPLSLGDVITQGNSIYYPAAGAQSLFPLSIYIAEGGKVQDNQGRPNLEEPVLQSTLDYIQQASLAEVMPYTLTQYTDDAQVWEAMIAGRAPMAVTWASTYLNDSRVDPASLVMTPLPTPDGKPFTLATGWSWALAGQDSTRRASAVRLAEFLADKSFVAGWAEASGYLPPRVDALQAWPATPTRQVIEQASYSAWLLPPGDILSTIGPALRTAVLSVLAGTSDAASAARSATTQVNQP